MLMALMVHPDRPGPQGLPALMVLRDFRVLPDRRGLLVPPVREAVLRGQSVRRDRRGHRALRERGEVVWQDHPGRPALRARQVRPDHLEPPALRAID